jgi:hypothetical protein
MVKDLTYPAGLRWETKEAMSLSSSWSIVGKLHEDKLEHCPMNIRDRTYNAGQ